MLSTFSTLLMLTLGLASSEDNGADAQITVKEYLVFICGNGEWLRQSTEMPEFNTEIEDSLLMINVSSHIRLVRETFNGSDITLMLAINFSNFRYAEDVSVTAC